jgi:multimeric flavodoxin WrbA
MEGNMKTLIINGSPRKNGDSMTLVNEMRKFLEGEVKIVNTYYDNISGCIDCRYCWKNSGCTINDGMQEIYKFLDDADNIIISSPIYFSELTGSLLNFASRLQTLYAAKRKRKDNEFSLKKKKGVLIISAGGDSMNLEARTLETANIIFNHMNTKSIGTVYTLQTDDIPDKENINALNKAREFALELNRLHIGSDI